MIKTKSTIQLDLRQCGQLNAVNYSILPFSECQSKGRQLHYIDISYSSIYSYIAVAIATQNHLSLITTASHVGYSFNIASYKVFITVSKLSLLKLSENHKPKYIKHSRWLHAQWEFLEMVETEDHAIASYLINSYTYSQLVIQDPQ